MPATLTVDQSLVDAYLERANRFYDNVEKFASDLKDMLKRPESVTEVREQPVYQETVAAQPEQAVVTADDIDLDDLLRGVDLGGVSL